ncbi:MAG: HAMP domain-containing histidine kinase [Desulfobacterales bacterium]|nr:HAMP domain-containing histidine kinase [Desulfobacterales bacterium]
MKSRRFITLFWVLLLVPAVIISAVAFKLLFHEQERINLTIITSLTERAEIIASNIHIIVREVEKSLSQALIDIKPEQLEPTLLLWEETNPLIRNVYIWDKQNLLEYPLKGMASTLEERQFITRFDSIFVTGKAFDTDSQKAESELSIDSQSSKESLYDLAKGKTIKKGNVQTMFTPQSGWIPWFAQDQLFILGWVKKSRDGPVYGVELELASLLSRLIPDLPQIKEKGISFAILNSRKQIMHMSGDTAVEDAQACDIAVSLSNLLPHWQVCIYLDRESFTQGKGFLYVSVLLLFIFMAAIISGGLLLTSQTRKHMKDAMQKTSFVSSVSHELKTPLTSIRMYAELMLDGRSKSIEKTKHYLEVMVSQSQRLTRLINNILDFGKLEQGKKIYNKRAVDLSQLLAIIIDAHGIRIKKAGFEIKTDIGEPKINESSFMVISDPDAIEQVVLNMVDNALKYAGEGKFIAFKLENDSKDFILLKISDHGSGISKTHQKAIFEKFYRIDNSLTSTFPGSGLGLSIARQILRDLDGDLIFEPVPEGGSCFIARIPKK